MRLRAYTTIHDANTPPRGEGGKNDQNRGEVAGQNKSPNLNFLQ